MRAYIYLIGILIVSLVLALMVANDKIKQLELEVQKWERVLK